MATASLTDFAPQYLQTWTEPDPQVRRAHLDAIWATDGRLVVSPLGLTLHGTDEISEHIAGVYEQNIAGRGLRFIYDQDAEARDALLLRWSMLAPDNSTVGRGVDLVLRDDDGLVRTVYMFMGID